MAYLNTSIASGNGLTQRLSQFYHAGILRLQQYRSYRETFDGLNALTNRELADLGLTRSELPYVARQASKNVTL
ncbi:DUF1127 domain containing protein [Sulfitobacter noctilucae]|uniref:DUF1127 domain-containing protein n=1 Tax=Sulfitobacter noctilucae TaxID=1342302 RepID=UPI00046AA01A|nr:DUF1127 domain-containing protein [Sulfitobacter noctilucae]KIN61514.1 DUF1127 domain containing protein [Sulfitobacter noctilucae]